MGENKRYDELEDILMEQRWKLRGEVRKAVRGARDLDDLSRKHTGLEDMESYDSVQEDIELALIELKASTLANVNEALVRLEQGRYGDCDDCGDQIAEKRLRALPFAIRCKECEEAREAAEQRERELALRRGSAARMLFLSDDF